MGTLLWIGLAAVVVVLSYRGLMRSIDQVDIAKECNTMPFSTWFWPQFDATIEHEEDEKVT